jgi:iron-sulfur cluster repair protein YtfE (RIC family)
MSGQSKHSITGGAFLENSNELFTFLDETHQDIYVKLNWISTLMSEVEIHNYTTQHQKQIEEVCRFFDVEVRGHHVDEERYVFPSLLLKQDPNLAELTRKLFVDHERFEESWKHISMMLKALLHGNEWFTSKELRQEFNAFHVLNLKHMKLEESIVYPEASNTDLSGESKEIQVEMHEHKAKHTHSA